MPAIIGFYLWWYPTRWLGWSLWPKYSGFGRLARHLRFVESVSRKLARASFHGMLVYQARLQTKQAFLFRLVDITNEAFAMAAAITRAQALVEAKAAESAEAVRLADGFCRSARRRVRAPFRDLWSNDDVSRYRLGLSVLEGRHRWLESGLIEAPAPSAERDEIPRELSVGA